MGFGLVQRRGPARRRLALAALAGTALTALMAPSAALATPATEVLLGDYLKIGVNQAGTLGSGGATPPGILYDGAGTGTFNPAYDYLTPGTPQEAFVLVGTTSGGAFTATNSNASIGSAEVSGSLSNYNGVAYNGTTFDQRVVWTGTYGSTLSVTHDYHFNAAGQQLQIETRITALTDITGLSFVRLTDPDAIAAPGDSSATNNFQGSGSTPGTDLIYAEATVSKYVIGLYSNDPTSHVTGAPGFTTAPAGYLAGTFLGNGDYTIGMAFTIGSLANGASLNLNYSYIFGTDIAAAVNANGGGGSPAPEPPPPTNIEAGGTYSAEDLTSGKVKPVFEGGTLTLSATGEVTTDLTVMAAGGGIDTAGHDLTLAGTISGDGKLNKLGDGVLTLTGANTFGGVTLGAGVLAIDSDAALGAADASLTLAGGELRALSSLTLARKLEIDGGRRFTLDTMANNVALTGEIAGGGTLNKVGAGTLTLSGPSTLDVLDIQGGTVVAGSQAALGAANGRIVLNADTRFVTATSLTVTQGVEIAGSNARFDTGAGQVVLTGALSGDACFIKAGSGQLNLLGAGSNAIGACVQEGQLSFNNTFAGNVFVSPGASVGGSGLIEGAVQVRGILSPGNSPGRLVVAGSVTQDAGGVLALDIDGPTPGIGAGHYDTLVLTGAGSVFTAAGTIAPITRGITGDATNSYTPRIGDAYTVVTAQGGVTGAFSTLVQPTSGMPTNARFEVFYAPGAVVLAVTPERYAALALGNGNAEAVAGAVDTLRTAPNAFTGSLVGLNEVQIAGVFERAAGEVHADGVEAVLQANRAVRAEISERMTARGDGVWAQVSGETRKVGADDTAGRYRADRTGVVVGADRMVGPTVRVGGAVAYAETEVKAGALGLGRSFSYQGLAYAGWRSGHWYANGVVAAGSDLYKAVRGATYAKPEGTSFAADVEVGRVLDLGPASVTLAAGLGKDRVKRDAVVEAGDPVTALSFDKVTRDALQARFGARIERRTALGGARVTPYAQAFVLRELDDDRTELDARLQGAAFEVASSSPGKTAVRLGVGLDAAVSARAKISLGYHYEGAREAKSHAGMITGVWAW